MATKHTHARLTLDDALKRVAQSSYRLTRPRRALLETVLKQTKPFSAPSLEKKLEGECDPVTIYRTLPVFIDLGLIEKCDFNDEMTHYEVVHGDHSHHHHHVVCVKCKKVEALELCLVEAQENALKRLGYRDLRHRLEFSGVCPSCR